MIYTDTDIDSLINEYTIEKEILEKKSVEDAVFPEGSSPLRGTSSPLESSPLRGTVFPLGSVLFGDTILRNLVLTRVFDFVALLFLGGGVFDLDVLIYSHFTLYTKK